MVFMLMVMLFAVSPWCYSMAQIFHSFKINIYGKGRVPTEILLFILLAKILVYAECGLWRYPLREVSKEGFSILQRSIKEGIARETTEVAANKPEVLFVPGRDPIDLVEDTLIHIFNFYGCTLRRITGITLLLLIDR